MKRKAHNEKWEKHWMLLSLLSGRQRETKKRKREKIEATSHYLLSHLDRPRVRRGLSPLLFHLLIQGMRVICDGWGGGAMQELVLSTS